MEKAALYIRVSTENQLELSPDSQRKLLVEYAERNNLLVDEEYIFCDGGISGRKAEKRPEFMKMISLAKKKDKPFTKILVWKFSRFARNREESVVYKNMLKKNKITVISVSEPIDDGPFGGLIESIIEWMDEYYSIRLSTEVTRGMKEKAARGGVQSSPVLGYDIVDNQYVLNKDEAEIVKKAYDLLLQGDTCGVIARYFNTLGYKNKKGNLFTGSVVRYMIQNPVYYGMIRWNYATQQGTGRKVNPEDEWIIAKGKHEPIISEAIWKEANKILGTTKTTTKPASTSYRHWLGGLLRCKECGGTLTFGTTNSKKNGKVYPFHKYSCNNYAKGKCRFSNSIGVKKIETEVIAMLNEVTYLLESDYDIAKLDIKIKNSNKDNELLKKQLERLDRQLKIAKEAYLKEVDTLEEYKENKANIIKQKEEIKSKLTSEPTENIKPIVYERCKNAISAIEKNESIETINKILKSFIECIEFSRKDDVLHMKLYYDSSST